MQYGIVVDSGCDLTHLETPVSTEIAFTRVPLKLDVGEKEFIDDFNLNIEEYMKEASEYKGKTGSAAPSPQTWYEAYEQSEYVFAISITSNLSGSYGSAKTAADMFKEEYPNRKICLIDSKTAGPEITILVKKLVDFISEGLDFDTICERISAYQEKTHTLFVLKSLDNLIKNGRVSKFKGTVAGLLGIKMLGTASDQGDLELLQKCRGKMTAYDKLVEEMLNRNYSGGKVIIGHCFAEDTAEYIASVLRSKHSDADIEIMPSSGLCSFYAEYGGIMLGFESN